MNIIGRKKIFLSISGILVAASLLGVGVFGFRQGIDFSGGTLWQFKIPTPDTPVSPNLRELEKLFKNELKLSGDIRFNLDSVNNILLVRLGVVPETDHQRVLESLQTQFPTIEELSFESIGPSVGQELRKNAMIAIALVLVGISLYIAFAFRKTSRPVSSWKYGWITLITLFHDIAIPAGLLSLLGAYGKVEIDSNFVVALLAVMGFSVHDTIVVFDRIRENLSVSRGKIEFADLVNQSVGQTIARSINTSLTLILVLIAMYLVGPITLKYFILTLLVGVTAGTYSSIFVASPLLVIWQGLKSKQLTQTK